MRTRKPQARITKVSARAFRVPTDLPESDGTFEWNSTTMVLAAVTAGDVRGIGYSYTAAAAAGLIDELLAPLVEGGDALDLPANWNRMVQAIRNLGRPGICSMAIAAVDTALWDLKARLLDVPLVNLLGMARDSVPVYGSGGFTSYTKRQLQRQLAGWAAEGISRVKMKIGREPEKDLDRVRAARKAIGPNTELFVDANGAYSRKQALAQSAHFAEFDVTWFEEPVSSDDLECLRLIRNGAAPGIEITAGEYGFDAVYFRRMLEAGAVDVIQPDATRCAGITGFLQAAVLADAFHIPVSAHTAPALHVHPCCALANVRHVEYFHDHARIEQMFFDGAARAVNGVLRPDLSRPGLGLGFKAKDAERFQV